MEPYFHNLDLDFQRTKTVSLSGGNIDSIDTKVGVGIDQ